MPDPVRPDPLVAALREAGCVYAEDEAALLRESARDEAHLAALVAARVAGEPLEQLVGWVKLRGLRLSVGPGVFVPRQRTRLLAEVAIEALRSSGAVFVEAFAGVGPVAASVRAALPRVDVHVIEIDEAALEHAHANLGEAAGIHRGSVLDGLPTGLAGRVDVIAAVPPYVPSGAAGLLPREARDFEPSRALLAGDDGLDQARRLIAEAPGWLAPGGRLCLELNRAQLAEARGAASGLVAMDHRADDGQTVVLELTRPELDDPPGQPCTC